METLYRVTAFAKEKGYPIVQITTQAPGKYVAHAGDYRDPTKFASYGEHERIEDAIEDLYGVLNRIGG